MADTVSMALAELVRKAEVNGDVDFLREGVRVLSQALSARLIGAHRVDFRTAIRRVREGKLRQRLAAHVEPH